RGGGGAREIGYVAAAQTAPLVAFLLVGGVAADWRGSRNVMLAADCLRCASEALLAVLLFAGQPPLWAMMALAAMLGTGLAFYGPSVNALVPQLVGEDWLREAYSLLSMPFSIGFLAGPALAGIIVALGGSSWAIAIDAATFGVSALCLSRLDLAGRPAAAA